MTEEVGSQGSSIGNTMQPLPEVQVPQEKLFKQSDVNEIVGAAKHEAVERYKRQNELSSSTAQIHQTLSNQAPPVSHSADENIRKLAAEEAQRLRDEWIRDAQEQACQQEAHKLVTEFNTKLAAGKTKYNDFDKVISKIDLRKVSDIVQVTNLVDNTADVMYEIMNDLSKLAKIRQLFAIEPQAAYDEVLKISQSIKDNEAAGKVKLPNKPLSQLKPTNTGTDNGALTVSDYRRKWKV